MPEEKTTSIASGDELKINDNELLRRFLRKNEADASYSRVSAQGIGSMVSLQTALADDFLREELAKALEAKGATVGDKKLAKFFRVISDTNMDKLLDGVDRTVPKKRVRLTAHPDLKNYLAEKGFAPELMPVFASRGITSLNSLNRVIANKEKNDTYNDLLKALEHGTEIDGETYPGSPELADGFKTLSEPEIESVQDIQQEIRPNFRQTGLDENAQNRYSQLKQAVQEVDALRQKDADAAKSLAEGISKDTQARLDSILSRANSLELLSVFDKHAPVTVKDLNTALDAVSDRLISGAQDSLNGLIEEQKKEMSEEDLAAANCIRRGVLITATGIYECSGSDLVKGICGRGTPGPYEEVTCDYESEQNYQLAEKTIKESSHTYSTSNSILGGFFSSSGIGAASGAFQYAQSTMSSEAKSRAVQTGNAVKVKERSIYAPKAVLTLPRERIELSRTALRYLKQIAAEKDQQKQNEYARLFLANFGGHVFRSVTLGGRYSYVAKAESTNKTTYEDLNSALSDAQETAGSSSAGFFGSFLLGGSSAHQDKKTSASATSMTTIAGKQNQTVRVSISVRGGLQEMPLDQWKQSLLLEKWWRVIDRREAIAVWDLLRVAEVSGLDDSKRKDLATLLERVWVRDVFLASLAESKMAGYQKFAQILKIQPVPDSVTTLESMLRAEASKLATPKMVFRYLTLTTSLEKDKMSRGGEMVITLPESWKILSGGGGTLGNTSHVLIESYPNEATAPGRKPRWEWHLKTKAAVCADGCDPCSSEESAKAQLTIGLIVLYDPKDEWDVKVLSHNSPKEIKQNIQVGMDSGYVITGGGARIGCYGISAITGSGFSLDAVDGNPLQAYCVKTNNMASDHNDDHNKAIHSLTAYCIAIRAANGAPLQPTYSTRVISDKSKPKECHLKDELVHVHDTSDSLMIGGGAWVSGEMNFLSWSLPVLEPGGRGLWKAYSADRAGKHDDQKMQIVTIGLKNVQTSLQTGEPPQEFAKYTFTDKFEDWSRTGSKFEKR